MVNLGGFTMSYFGPTTTKEVGTVRRIPLWLVIVRLVSPLLRRRSRQIWAKCSAPMFGRSGLERFASRAASLLMAILLAGFAARGEVASAAARPSGAKSSARLSVASQSVSAKSRHAASVKTSNAPRSVSFVANPLAAVPLAKKPIATKSPTVKRFGGRVQQDALGRWIVDGALIGLATVNIPGGQDAVFDTTVPAGLTPLELRGHYVIPSSATESWLEIGISGGTPQRVNSTKGRSFSVQTFLGAGSSNPSVNLNDVNANNPASNNANAASIRVVNGGATTDYVEFTARRSIPAARTISLRNSTSCNS
jgi:hypothetical protein